MYGVFDATLIDTSPGAGNTFAPPAGWQGDRKAYANLMHARYTEDPGARQHMVLVGIHVKEQLVTTTFTGPFANVAKRIALAVIKPGKAHATSVS